MIEQELKFKIKDSETALTLFDCPLVASSAESEAEEIKMDAVYYDTKDRLLARNGVSFRIRRENDDSVATIKFPSDRRGAMHVREEIETSAGDDETPQKALEVLLETSHRPALAEEIKKELRNNPLTALCETDFTRLQHKVHSGGADFLVCVDLGTVRAGGRTEEICELEIEYVSGHMEGLYDFAAALKDAFGLVNEPSSKFARGMDLLSKPQ